MLKRLRLGRSGPSLVLAMIALAVALGGTSFAAGSGGGHDDIKQDKELIKKMAKTLRVKFAKTAGTANSATTAASATSATSATNATNATNADAAAKVKDQGSGSFSADQLVRASVTDAGNKADPCGGPALLTHFGSLAFTAALTKDVTAPVAGILLIWGRVSAEFDSSSPASSYLRLRGRLTVDGTQGGPEGEMSLADSAASCKEGRTMALNTAFPVAAGNHTVQVELAKSTITSGTGLAYVGNGLLMTLFVPFGNAGSQGTLGTVPLTDPGRSGSNR